MDPLSALSLAGNVLQFIDFGTKLFSKAGELYKSTVGSLAANDQLELVTADLRALVSKLRQSLSSEETQGEIVQEDKETWSSFKRVCDEAADVADEIILRLGKLRLQDGKFRRLRSILQAVETLWSEREITSLLKRLSSLRIALETRVLFSIR
jgi:RecA-family ATPase